MFGSRRAVVEKSVSAAPDAGQEALRFLASQGLPATPENYALAWNAKVDRDGFVAKAVDAILMDGRTVLPTDVARITATANVSAAGREDDRRHDDLRHQTLRLADLAAGASASSSSFGRDLADGLHRLDGPDATHRIVQAMIDRTRAVEAELRSASDEIEKLREQVESVRADAHHDALTGLLNRRGAMRELAGRPRGEVAVLALCDVDRFKSVNDRFGHGVGDRVLKGVAASLGGSLAAHRVARWGGEEFLVLLDGLDLEEAVVFLDGARADLAARTFRVRETDQPLGSITVSIGAAVLRHGDVDEAIEAADRRLYAAKRGGRDRVQSRDEEAAV